MAHWRREDGTVVGHGPTAREIDAVSRLFTSTRHVACLHDGPAPLIALPYTSRAVTLVPVPPAGGPRLWDKLHVARLSAHYLGVISRELRHADAVHVRCPANVPLLALGALTFRAQPRVRWLKFAGDWHRSGTAEPFSYRLQRAWLRSGVLRANVTVNGARAADPPHVLSFVNPCLTDEELELSARAAAGKTLGSPIELAFVGHLEPAKGAETCLYVVRQLKEHGCACRLTIVGSGSEAGRLNALATDLGVAAWVSFVGALPRPELTAVYGRAHFVLLPSHSEGWPKVLSEGMAAGALPIASDVGSVAATLRRLTVGRVADWRRPSDFTDAVMSYVERPDQWSLESSTAVVAAHEFTYSAFCRRLAPILETSPRPSKAPENR